MTVNKKYEVLEIEEYARSLGFTDMKRIGYDGLDRVLGKLCGDGYYTLELRYTDRDDAIYDYGINAWLNWRGVHGSPMSEALVSLYDSGYDYTAGGTRVFRAMLRTLDMVDGKFKKANSRIYLDNWYNAAVLEAL